MMSLAVMLGLFVLTPWVLMTAARARFDTANPLHDIAPPWRWNLSEIGDVLAEPLRDDAVVNLLIRSCLTIIWIALATVAITIVVEVVHMIRHRGIASPRVRGLGWAQRIARWIAVGIIALLPLNSFGTAAAGLDQSPGPVATAQRFVEPVTATPFDTDADRATSTRVGTPQSFGDEHRSPRPFGNPSDVATPTAGGSHTVQRGESIYGIAGEYADGDADRTNTIADAILDLNLGEVMNDGQRFVNPALIQPGWDLSLPAGLSGQADADPATDTGSRPAQTGPLDHIPDADGFDVTADDAPTPVRGTPRIDVDSDKADPSAQTDGHIAHVVVTGDTLSDIAEDHLGDQDAWPQIWEANAGDDMGGGRTFDDPNLILPGWEIEVPVEYSPPAHEPVVTDQAEPSDRTDDDMRTKKGELSGWEDTTVPRETATRATPPPSVPSAPPAPATSIPTAAGAGEQAGSADWAEPAPQAPSPIRLEHAALLAAGILTLVGVRRRRALRAALPHARVPTPAPAIAATERRLRTIDPGERWARVDIAVRAIAHRIAGTGIQVGTVRIAPDGELIARLTGAVRLEAPWIGADGSGPGRTWTLPASVPIEMVSDDARQAGQPCLALVTVGIDIDGRDVLLDLEAAGVTAIEATPDQGDEVVRAIGSGLATSLSSEVVHLLVAELGIDVLFDHPNARRVERTAHAVDAAARIVGSTLASERSAFDLRARRTGGEMWEPAVILLAHADDAAHSLPSLPPVGHGIAAVAAVDLGAFHDSSGSNQARAWVRARADGWELDAFDERIELTPIGLSDTDVAGIVEILEDASKPIEIAPLVHVDLDNVVADPFDVTPHDIIVTMMGGVSVVDRDGNVGTFQRSKTVELIAWLATHREHATRSAARTALWELDVRDATFANVVSEARRALARLVPPPDDGEWLARTLNESLPLHERVVTDADLIRQRVEHAQVAPPAHAVDVLRPAVEMIHGLPFAGSSFLWPDADGLTSNLVLLATTASAELAAHALSMGDTDLVFWATGQGLKVLPGHEELIGLRMRAHARAGDLSGVRQEWESYERVITADSWSDGEPAPKLLDLRRELLTSSN